MSDIFEQDIYDDTEDLSSLEDGYTSDDRGSENFVFPKDLYRLKLDYSCEGVYATAPEGLSVKAGERVIVLHVTEVILQSILAGQTVL